MSVLSDTSIRTLLSSKSSNRLVIEPYLPEAVQPASYDIRLGSQLLMRERGRTVDPMRGQGPRWLSLVDDGEWLLYPEHLYLGVTLERVEIPNDLLCQLHGRSSLGREGIVIHQTAGLVDPGYRGHLTLEITVTHATILRAGMPIGQLTFHRLTTAAEHPYSGRYQGDAAPQPARMLEAHRCPTS